MKRDVIYVVTLFLTVFYWVGEMNPYTQSERAFHNFMLSNNPYHLYLDPSVDYKDLLLQRFVESHSNTLKIISHGKQGKLFINNSWYNAKDIGEWLHINFNLNQFDGVAIFGCEFGKGEEGRNAVGYLQKLLNIPISASKNITGFNGDWTLEIGAVMHFEGLGNYKSNLQHFAVSDVEAKHKEPSLDPFSTFGPYGANFSNTSNLVFNRLEEKVDAFDVSLDNWCNSSISSFPYSEGFESGLGDWTHVSGDDFNWTRDSRGTPSRNTGPSSGSNSSTYYVYTEATSNFYNTAYLQGPCFDLTNAVDANFSFDYHMYGSTMGLLQLEISLDGNTWSLLETKSGNKGNVWNSHSESIIAYVGNKVRFRFKGTTGYSYQSDMAIDNIQLTVTEGSPDNNNNTDTDGDGIVDVVDLDDDNDGILDTDECTFIRQLVFLEEFSTLPTTDLVPDGTCTAAGDNPDDAGSYILTDLANSPLVGGWKTPSGNNDGAAPAGVSFPTGNALFFNAFGNEGIWCQQISDDNNGNGLGGELARFEVSNVQSGVYVLSVFLAELTNTNPHTSSYSFVIINSSNNNQIASIRANNLDNGDRDWQYNEGSFSISNNTNLSLILLQTQNEDVGADVAIDNLALYKVVTCQDTDGDNLSDDIDNDSDGDGCADAIEGGGNFTMNNIDVNDRLTGGVNSNGIPSLVGSSGQTEGDSKNKNKQSSDCCNSMAATLSKS